MTRKIITAKYCSNCYECGERIIPGARVVYDSDTGIVWHLECDRGHEDETRPFDPYAYFRKVDDKDVVIRLVGVALP